MDLVSINTTKGTAEHHLVSRNANNNRDLGSHSNIKIPTAAVLPSGENSAQNSQRGSNHHSMFSMPYSALQSQDHYLQQLSLSQMSDNTVIKVAPLISTVSRGGAPGEHSS